MITVWKYPLEIVDEQTLKMPFGAEPIHVGLDPMNQPCLWAKVESVNSPVNHVIHLSGTGNPTPDGDCEHIGSFVEGAFVWHVWIPLA